MASENNMATEKKIKKTKPAVSTKAAKPASTLPKRPRKLKQPQYKTFKLAKRIKSPHPPLPGVIRLTKQSYSVLRDNWKLFLGIALVYAALNIILVRGFANSLDLTQAKASLQEMSSSKPGNLVIASTLFSYLLSGSGASTNANSGVYQTMLVLLLSLVIIWTLRQVIAGIKVGVREAYYKGAYPVVPFMLVLMVVGIELVPLLAGGWLYTTIVSGGVAVGAFEKVAVFSVSFLLAILSLYMACSSLFALFIATLPDMTPIKALRSARQLVKHRRWMVLRKILFLPVILLILTVMVMTPFLIFLTGLAEVAFFALGILLLMLVNSYMYTLYRELL